MFRADLLRRVLAAVLFALALAPSEAEAGLAFPVYGNWCGPGHGSGPALDGLDAACKRHDICTVKVRDFDCGCDLAFMDELRRRSWPSQALYLKARGVYELIALVPCLGTPAQQETKIDWVRNDHLGAIARGREAPDDAFTRGLDLIGIGLAGAYIRRR